LDAYILVAGSCPLVVKEACRRLSFVRSVRHCRNNGFALCRLVQESLRGI
jgi:hypothetical protein